MRGRLPPFTPHGQEENRDRFSFCDYLAWGQGRRSKGRGGGLRKRTKGPLAHALRAARENSGHTQESAALAAADHGVRLSPAAVSHYESGSLPSPEKLLALCRVYGVTVGSLFKAIGAADEEICGHHFTPEQQETLDGLAAIFKAGGKRAETIRELIRLLGD